MKIESMNRMFLPVGQGAFYCERFWGLGRPINIVYDCGTLTGKNNEERLKLINKAVDTHFEDGEVIDAVFLSHLHEDHFNGLDSLHKKGQIQRIYLPHMEQLDLKLLQLDYVMSNPIPPDNNTQDLVNRVLGDENVMDDADLRKILQPLCQEINDHEGDDESDSYYHIGNNDTINANQKGTIFVRDSQPPVESCIGPSNRRQGRSPFDNWGCWHFKAFCIKNHEVIETIKGELKEFIEAELRKVNELGEDNDLPKLIAKMIRLIKDKASPNGQQTNGQPTESPNEFLKRIRSKVYKMFSDKELNANSLVLYSGCDNMSGLAEVRRPMCCSAKALYDKMCCHPVGKVGCLYTGDFNAKDNWDVLCKGLTPGEMLTIGCIQIPHHGSEGYFNEKFLGNKTFPDPAACHVISAGLGNGYKHPRESVLKMYNQKHCFPIVVTQDPGSLAEWRIQRSECFQIIEYHYDSQDYWAMRCCRGLHP